MRWKAKMNEDRLNTFSRQTVKNIKQASKIDRDLDYEKKIVKHKHSIREEQFDHWFGLCCHGLTISILIVCLFVCWAISKIKQDPSSLIEISELGITILLSAVGGVFIRERLERRVK